MFLGLIEMIFQTGIIFNLSYLLFRSAAGAKIVLKVNTAFSKGV